MRLDFKPATDAAMYVLFDPAAVPTLIQGSFGPFRGIGEFVEAIGEEAERGKILVYYDHGDGDPSIRAYVDEPPEERLVARACRRLDDSLLHVPSGRLFCMGGEYLGATDEEATTPATYRPSEGYLGAEARIPPGIYRLSAFDIDYDPSEDYEELIRAQMGDELAAVYESSNTATGCGCLATVACFVVVAMVAGYSYLFDSWWLTWVSIPASTLALIAMWSWIIRRSQSSDVQRARALREDAEREWPFIVIVLTRVDSAIPPVAFRPAKLGPGLL